MVKTPNAKEKKQLYDEYQLIYKRNLHDINNSYKYNFVKNITQLVDSMDKVDVDTEERAQNVYKILYTLGRMKEFTLPETYNMTAVHTIFHTEIFQLGEETYRTLISGLYKAFLKGDPRRLLLTTPLVKETREEFNNHNNKLRYFTICSYLKFQSKFTNDVDTPLLDTLFSALPRYDILLDDVSDIVNTIGRSEDPEDHTMYKSYRAKLEEYLDTLDIVCERDAYSDDIAIFVESSETLSANMRASYSFWFALKKLGYRLTLIYTHRNLNLNMYKNLFDRFLQLPIRFNAIKAKELSKLRYRVVFYTSTNSIWSVLMTNNRLGLTQVNILQHGVSSGLKNMDYVLSSDNFNTKLASGEQQLVLPGVAHSLTSIKPQNLPTLTKTNDTFLIYCPWEFNQITHTSCAVLKKINDLLAKRKSKIQIQFVFYSMGGVSSLVDYNCVLEHVVSKYIDNYMICHSGVEEYYTLYNTVDLVLLSTPYCPHTVLIDALTAGKVCFAIDDNTNYMSGCNANILKSITLSDFCYDNVDNYVKGIASFINNKSHRAKYQKLINNLDLNKVINNYNLDLDSEFIKVCSKDLKLEDRSNIVVNDEDDFAKPTTRSRVGADGKHDEDCDSDNSSDNDEDLKSELSNTNKTIQ
jgi:hypothetical protein